MRLEARREDGALRVDVRDNGIGIAKKDHSRIFERFQQAGNTLTDKPAGTGLGLPISREILQHFDGEIWVESEIGKGATFSFRIPAAGTRDRDCSSDRRSRTQTGLKYNSGRTATRGWQDDLVNSASCARREIGLQDGAHVDDGPQAGHEMVLFALAQPLFGHEVADLAAGCEILDSVGATAGAR